VHLSEFAQHQLTLTEGAPQVITALDIVAFIATSTNISHLNAIAHAVKCRTTELNDGQLWRDIVADNKVNPVMNALPACPTEWSHTRFALWELEQQQRIAERDAARTQ
jgi:hypothetical protein